MRFSFLGVEFHISVPFTVLVSFLLIVDKSGLMSASLLAVLIHEMGHIIAMYRLKCLPREISFNLSGILICGTSYCTFGESYIIAIMGPIFNVLAFAVLIFFGIMLDNNFLKCFSAVQLIEGLTNLLPVKSLDGGTLLNIFLKKINIKRCDLVFKLVSLAFSIIIFVLGTAVAVKNVENPTLILLGIYLIILNIIKT